MHLPIQSLALLAIASLPSVSALPRFLQRQCAYHQPSSDAVQDLYIVKLKSGHTLDAHFSHIGQNLSDSGNHFSHMPRLNAYHARLDEHTVHQLIRYDPMVEYVEQDHYLSIPEDTNSAVRSEGEYIQNVTEVPWVAPSTHTLNRRDVPFTVTEEDSEWWHAYITRGQTVNPKNREKLSAWNFEGAGSGVDIYVLDSGVRLSHSWFQGRASNFQGLSVSPYTGSPADDFDSHGTHVASIAARVAPGAKIINVKVACKRANNDKDKEAHCQPGTGGGYVQALVDIAAEHDKNMKNPPEGWKGSVINLSLAVKASQSILAAVELVTAEQQIPIAVAAGNGNTDKVDAPCIYSKNTMCVGAVDRSYNKFVASNYGKRIGVFAPGDFVTAATIDGDNAVTYKSGTSQASPMVAGAMAIYIGWEGITDNVNAIYFRVIDNTLPNVVQGVDDKTTKMFLNTGINNPEKPQKDPYNGMSGPASPPSKREEQGKANFRREGPTFKTAESALVPPPGPTSTHPPDGGDDSDGPQPAAPTGASTATFSVASVQATLPNGYASVGAADANGPDATRVVTVSWTASMHTVSAAASTSEADVFSLTGDEAPTTVPVPTSK